jgi:hypothetical protein
VGRGRQSEVKKNKIKILSLFSSFSFSRMEEFIEKAAQWRQMNKRKYESKKRKQMKPQKEQMPPEHLRKIMKDHGDMSVKKFQNDKRIYLGALKFVPHAILKLLGNNILTRKHADALGTS